MRFILSLLIFATSSLLFAQNRLCAWRLMLINTTKSNLQKMAFSMNITMEKGLVLDLNISNYRKELTYLGFDFEYIKPIYKE